VGSHVAAALVRNDVTTLRLVDFDQVTLSSLNRHAVATPAGVNFSKVKYMPKRLVAITPWIEFDLRPEKFGAEAAEKLIAPRGERPDFVVDCSDTLDPKLHIVKYCHEHKLPKIPAISPASAGCKTDPARLTRADNKFEAPSFQTIRSQVSWPLWHTYNIQRMSTFLRLDTLKLASHQEDR